MLGLFLIYFIGKSFYTLAGKFNKHQWGFGLLGVGLFYLYQIVFGILYFAAFAESYEISSSKEMSLNILGLLVGGLFVLITYKLLEGYWEKGSVKSNTDDDILDGELFL